MDKKKKITESRVNLIAKVLASIAALIAAIAQLIQALK